MIIKRLKKVPLIFFIVFLALTACNTDQRLIDSSDLSGIVTTVKPALGNEHEGSGNRNQLHKQSFEGPGIRAGCNPTIIKFSHDGSRVAVSCFDNELQIYALKNSGKFALEFAHNFESSIHFIDWSPNSGMVALVSWGTLHIMDINKGKVINKLELSKTFGSKMAWSPDSKHIATTVPGSSLVTETDSLAKIYSVPELKLIKEVHVESLQSYGTNQLIWDGNVDAPTMTIATMGGMVHLSPNTSANLGFYGIQWNAAHIGIYSLGDDRYLTVTNEIGPKDDYSRTRLVVFDSQYMLFDYIIQNNLNGEELDPIVDSCYVIEESRLYVLFSSGKLQAFHILRNEIQMIWETQLSKQGLASKIEASFNYENLVITQHKQPVLFIPKP